MIGFAEEKSKNRKSKKQLSNDADSKHNHDHTEAAAGIRRIAADKFHDHVVMICVGFVGAILLVV
jgi:hypothetical protein